MMADGDTPITASGAATSPAVPAAQEPAPAATPPAATPAPVASPASPAPAASEAAPVAVEVKPEAAPEVPTPEPTLLEKFDTEQKAKEAKPGEEKKPDGEKPPAEAAPKPEGEKPAVEAAPPAAVELPPVEYKYELPDTLKMDDTVRAETHSALDKFRADPSNPQPLIDLHAKAMTEYAQHTSREQHRIFNETRQGWTKEVMSDPQLGGAGHQTAMGVVARMRDKFVAEADRPAFEEFLRITGAGDHPQFLRLLHNAGRLFDEPPLPPPNAKPTATNGANPNRRATLYDNPRSQTARQ